MMADAKKAWYNSEKVKFASQQAGEFVPYISNLVNAFRKTPRPMAPQMVNPVRVVGTSLANSRRQIQELARGADMAADQLDGNTAASVRSANLANAIRGISGVNAQEAELNARNVNQANQMNAAVDVQNAQIQNAYQDDLVNAKIARIRESSANVSNAADKFIQSKAASDARALDRDKAVILSKLYDRGLYGRYIDSLEDVTLPGEKRKNAHGGRLRKVFASGGKLTGGGKGTSETQQVNLMDLVSTFAGSGSASGPRNPELISGLRAQSKAQYGAGADLTLLNDLSAYNTDPNYAQYKGEERINQYYRRAAQSNNPIIRKMARDFSGYATGAGSAAAQLRYSPNVDVQGYQIDNKMYNPQVNASGNVAMSLRKNGGKLRKVY